MSSENLYYILGVSNTSTFEEIKSAYRTLSKKYHPDINSDDSETFKKVHNAYSILSDELKRKEYDLKSKWGRYYNESVELLNFEFENDSEIFDKSKIDKFKKNELLDIVVEVNDDFNGSIVYERWVICKNCNGSGRDTNSKIVIKDEDGNSKFFESEDGCDFCEGSGKDYYGNKCGFCFGNGKVGLNDCAKCSGSKRILGKQKLSGLKLSNDELTKVECMGNASKDEPGRVGHLWLKRIINKT